MGLDNQSVSSSFSGTRQNTIEPSASKFSRRKAGDFDTQLDVDQQTVPTVDSFRREKCRKMKDNIGTPAERDEMDMLAQVRPANSVALVVHVGRTFGRLLLLQNMHNPFILFYFDSTTFFDGTPIGLNLDAVVQPGLNVDIIYTVIAGEYNNRNHLVKGIVYVTGMITNRKETTTATQAVNVELKPELMIVLGSRQQSQLGTAASVTSGIVLLHSHALPIADIFGASLADSFGNKHVVGNRLELVAQLPVLYGHELLTTGRVLSIRAVNSPAWLLEIYPLITKVAVLINECGKSTRGCGRFAEMHPDCSYLVGENDEKIFFCHSSLPKYNGDEKLAWSVGSQIEYECCQELPGREFEFRAFRLKSLNDIHSYSLPNVHQLVPSSLNLPEIDGIGHFNGTNNISTESDEELAFQLQNDEYEGELGQCDVICPAPEPGRLRNSKPISFSAREIGCSDQSASENEDDDSASKFPNFQVNEIISIDAEQDLFSTLNTIFGADDQSNNEQTIGSDGKSFDNSMQNGKIFKFNEFFNDSTYQNFFGTLLSPICRPTSSTDFDQSSSVSIMNSPDQVSLNANSVDFEEIDIKVEEHENKVLISGPDGHARLVTKEERYIFDKTNVEKRQSVRNEFELNSVAKKPIDSDRLKLFLEKYPTLNSRYSEYFKK